MAEKKTTAKKRTSAKSRSKSRKSGYTKKQRLYISIAAVAIITVLIGVSLAMGWISPDEFMELMGLNSASPSPSASVSPTNTNILEGNTLIIGDEINGTLLDIHFIDVGQGDCIYIEFPDGKNMLIDAGKDNDEVEDAITSYLDSQEVTVIDYVMLTHTDEDHVGSMDKVLTEYQVKTLYIPDLIASDGMEDEQNVPGSISTIVYKEFIELAEIETYTEGSSTLDTQIRYNIGTLSITGAGYTMTVYCPDAEYYDDISNNSSAEDKNNVSPICVLTYAGRVVVFTGDADEEAEQRYVDMSPTVNADVLKVAHHGGADSSNSFFLTDVDPEYAVISCGTGNSYDHPRQAALDRLLAVGVEYLFRTDLNSDIVLTIDSEGDMRFITDIKASQTNEFIGADTASE
jgi:competence protein ComEC